MKKIFALLFGLLTLMFAACDKDVEEYTLVGVEDDNCVGVYSPEKLNLKMYEVSFSSNVKGASVKIDGVNKGVLPLTVKLTEGSHSILVTASGYEDYSEIINVTSSKSYRFTLHITLHTGVSGVSIKIGDVSFDLIWVEGGMFNMGSNSGNYDEKPVHSVTLDGYYIGKYEVTQALWQAVMGSNPSNFNGDNRPVEKVSWDDCQTFIYELNWLTGRKFSLPTEAQWEYAACGGNKSKGYTYSGGNTIGNVAWYYDNSNSQTHSVGQKAPNELGIYDMSGNVLEWCLDWYDRDYYSNSPSRNPVNYSVASYRVLRGGGWGNSAGLCRLAHRYYHTPANRNNNLGMRLVLLP